jgi:hypothetical protein
MIAIFLSSGLIFFLSSLYLSVHKNRLIHLAMMNIEDNIRVTYQILSKAIRDAGYVLSENKIAAYTGSEIKPGTDAFTVRGANTLTVPLIDTMQDPSSLYIHNTLHFAVGDKIVIHDTTRAEIFAIQAIQNNGNITRILTDHTLKKLYEKNAELSLYMLNTFYIGKTTRLNSDGSPLYALYKKDLNMHKTELIEGVSSMKIQYCVENEGMVQEVSAAAIEDWSKVQGVRLALEFSSSDTFPFKKNAFVYATFRE